MYSDDHRDPTAACVEFTFRMHSDGRRERLATVLGRDGDGIYRPAPRWPTCDLARFVAKAVGEAMEDSLQRGASIAKAPSRRSIAGGASSAR